MLKARWDSSAEQLLKHLCKYSEVNEMCVSFVFLF